MTEKIKSFCQNVWKYRLKNTVMASLWDFGTNDRNVSVTKLSQEKWPKCFSKKINRLRGMPQHEVFGDAMFYNLKFILYCLTHKIKTCRWTSGMFHVICYQLLYVNTLTSGLIQVVRRKQLDRTWLYAGISPFLYRLRIWLKCQKM